MKLMGDKVSKDAVVILFGLDNCTFYEENEEGDRSFPRADKEGHYLVIRRVEVARPRQIKGLMKNCAPIFEKLRRNKKVIFSPTVRCFRETCCDKADHCTNVGQTGTEGTWLQKWRRSGTRYLSSAGRTG